MGYLITETTQEIEIIKESLEEGKKPNLYIKGPFLQSEIINKNGRMYPFSIMEREVNRYIEEKIKRNNAGGELNHPTSATVNLDRIALKVESLTRDGNNFIGKAKITNTPMGDVARSLIDEGFNLGVSSRGIGSLKDHPKGYKQVCEDFRLCVAADIVSDPSGPDCWVNGIMEGVEFHWSENNGWMTEVIDNTKKSLDKLNKEDREKLGLTLFENHFNSLMKLKFQ